MPWVHNAHPFGLAAAPASEGEDHQGPRNALSYIIAAPQCARGCRCFCRTIFTFVLVKVFLCSFKVPNSSRA